MTRFPSPASRRSSWYAWQQDRRRRGATTPSGAPPRLRPPDPIDPDAEIEVILDGLDDPGGRFVGDLEGALKRLR